MTYKNRKSLLIHLLIGLIMFQILAIALAAYTGINGIYVILTAFYTVFVVIDIVTADIYDPTSEVTAEFIDDDYLCNGRPDEMCYINGQVDIFNPDKMYCVVSGKRAVGKTTFAKAMSIVNSDIQYITVQDINQLSHNVRQHAFMTYFLAITNNGLPHYIDEVGASNE